MEKFFLFTAEDKYGSSFRLNSFFIYIKFYLNYKLYFRWDNYSRTHLDTVIRNYILFFPCSQGIIDGGIAHRETHPHALYLASWALALEWFSSWNVMPVVAAV